MKIIVTGGAGFIGSHIAHAYKKANHDVVVIDNLSAGMRANAPKGSRLYKADIRDLASLRKIFKKEKPNVVNHHAAFISVTDSVKKPAETFANNIIGTSNVLIAFAESGAQKKKFLFASTGGAIYGNPKKIPATESTPPMPLSPYALSKYIDEQIITYYCNSYGIPFTIFRYANVYGPRQRSQGGAGIFPIFLNEMLRGAAPTIFGDGKKTRDYVYVGDVARANVLGLTRGAGEVVNIATNVETSDGEIFNALAAAINFKKQPNYTPSRKGEVRRISMSFAKAKRLLGWLPRTTLKDGVKKTVASF